VARGESAIRIAGPPDAIFGLVGDAANNPMWRRNVVRTEWVDDGPMRVGRRGRQTARVLGREYTVEAVVIEWDPPRAATSQTVQGPAKVRSWVRVEPDGDGAIVHYGADGSFLGPIGGLLTRLAVPRMIAQAQLDLQAVKRILEAPRPS
jgi:hypothetical protein